MEFIFLYAKLPNLNAVFISVRLEGKLFRSSHWGIALNFWSTSLGIFIVLTYPARAVDNTMKTKTMQNRITYLFISFPFGTFILNWKKNNNKRHIDPNESGLNIRIFTPKMSFDKIMLIALILSLYLIMYFGGRCSRSG